jgi:hypothetical protein
MNSEIEVARYTEVPEAEIAKGLLIANGIPCRLIIDDVGGMYPQMHLGEGMKLMVPPEFAEAAQKLLASFENGDEARQD